MRICFYEHTAPDQNVTLQVSRCKPTVGDVKYEVFFDRNPSCQQADGQQRIIKKVFKENDTIHPPHTVFMQTGDRLYAEVPDSSLLFSVSGVE